MEVALIDLGENLTISLDSLAKKLNPLQNSFNFSVLPSRPRLGNPDYESLWYESENLLNQLKEHACYDNFDYVIGITHARFTVMATTKRKKEKDYFSYGDFNKFIIMSEALAHYVPKNIDNYQFISYMIAGSLLSAICKVNLDHDEVSFCLFDECEDRSNIKQGILNGKICNICLGKLSHYNVSSSIIESINSILSWCKKVSNTTAIFSLLTNPISSLILGAFLGWILSEYIQKNILSTTIIILTTLIIHIILFIFYKRPK